MLSRISFTWRVAKFTFCLFLGVSLEYVLSDNNMSLNSKQNILSAGKPHYCTQSNLKTRVIGGPDRSSLVMQHNVTCRGNVGQINNRDASGFGGVSKTFNGGSSKLSSSYRRRTSSFP